MRARRDKRDLHGLNADGMLLCNPRDREAAHRAQVQQIATDDLDAITCVKCRRLAKTAALPVRSSRQR